MSVKITTQPCLLCDSPTDIAIDEWVSKEAPIALCDDCCPFVESGDVPWPLVQMIYVMRCQIAKQQSEMEVMKGQIGMLFSAQQELEQDFLLKRR